MLGEVYITTSTIWRVLQPLNYKIGYSNPSTIQNQSDNPSSGIKWWFCHCSCSCGWRHGDGPHVNHPLNYSKSQLSTRHHFIGSKNWDRKIIFTQFLFFEITQYNSDTHNTRILTPLWIQVRKLYPYEHLQRLSRQILEIDEVTTGASLSTGTSPTTECTMPLNFRIFAHMESRTQNLRCYGSSCNH